RVRYGDVVLSRATWFLRKDEREWMRDGSAADRLRMPRFVLYVDGDQELLVDLQNAITIEAFLALAARKEIAIVHEMLPQPDDLLVNGPDGHYTHELVLPFKRTAVSPVKTPARPALYRANDRNLPPRGEWLYLKLYTGYSTADRLLVDMIAPLAQRLRDEGMLRSWFFIRYRDPEFHLRVRLCGEPDVLWNDVLRAFSESFTPLLANGWMSRVQLDTYVREIERYGGVDGVKLAEDLFCADSDLVASLLPVVQSDPALRWQLAVFGTDALLNDLGFDAASKARVLERLVQLYGGEFRVDRNVRDQLAKQTRARRDDLRAIFNANEQPWSAAYRERSARVRALAIETPSDELASSYLHMHLNRWFRSTPRAQEFVVYDLLHRWVLSQLARERVTV
ncbi:MAG TPA: thiopeptide-type bacteriocin biosynthesis protein, partial [Thermoanaerobaculia bacterium]|nr:thiopeptide-type bacteriocin biosynthesis protein [Thermoanaerobaculia bacterium]